MAPLSLASQFTLVQLGCSWECLSICRAALASMALKEHKTVSMRTGKTLPQTALAWSCSKGFGFFFVIVRRVVQVPGRAAKTMEGMEPFQDGLEMLKLLKLEGMMEVCKIVTAAGKANGGTLLPQWMQTGAGAAG